MTESISRLSGLKRPRLLIRAARAGTAHYLRSRDLARILRGPVPLSPGVVLDMLIEEEARQERLRRQADAGYDIGHHVELLIAMLAEAQLLPRPVMAAE